MQERIHTAGQTTDTAPHDEAGTPSDDIERCTCGVLFRIGQGHRCRHVSEWISWERYQARQEASGVSA